MSLIKSTILVSWLLVAFFFSSTSVQSQSFIASQQTDSTQQQEDLRKPIQLEDLAYGEILFYYYRGDELTALTKIQIAQQKNLLPHHANSAALLSGVIYLNLGMLNRSQEIFNRLLSDDDLKSELLAKIEFYLAKIHYQQNDYSQAKSRLINVYLSLKIDLKNQALLMLSNIELSEGRLLDSKKWLEMVSEDSELLIFSEYNLAILWLKDKNIIQAKYFFNKIFMLNAPNDVQKNIQDKAKLALAYYFLQQKDLTSAKKYFLEVRLDSAFTNKALLGLGWVYIEQKQYKKALNHLLELSEKDLRDIAVQEALLAIPFAYQKLKALQPALNLYLEASKKYQLQIDLINKIENDLKNNHLVEKIVNESMFKQKPIFDEQKYLSLSHSNTKKQYESIQDFFESDYGYYLYELVAQNRFNESVKRYKKLGDFLKMLNYWEEQLPMFTEMLNINEVRFKQKLPEINQYLKLNTIQEYESLHALLKQDLINLRQSKKLYLAASPVQLKLYQRIKKVEDRIAFLPKSMINSDQINQLNRAKGVLDWQLEQGIEGKIRQLSNSIKEIDLSIKLMKHRMNKLSLANDYAVSRFLGVQTEIDHRSQTLYILKEKIKQKEAVESRGIKQKLLNELAKRKSSLEYFLLQSDLSVARLYEQAVSIKEVDL